MTVHKKKKNRQPRIFLTRSGRKYIKIGKKRLYLRTEPGISQKQLVRVIINNFEKRRKQKKRQKKQSRSELINGVGNKIDYLNFIQKAILNENDDLKKEIKEKEEEEKKRLALLGPPALPAPPVLPALPALLGPPVLPALPAPQVFPALPEPQIPALERVRIKDSPKVKKDSPKVRNKHKRSSNRSDEKDFIKYRKKDVSKVINDIKSMKKFANYKLTMMGDKKLTIKKITDVLPQYKPQRIKGSNGKTKKVKFTKQKSSN